MSPHTCFTINVNSSVVFVLGLSYYKMCPPQGSVIIQVVNCSLVSLRYTSIMVVVCLFSHFEVLFVWFCGLAWKGLKIYQYCWFYIIVFPFLYLSFPEISLKSFFLCNATDSSQIFIAKLAHLAPEFSSYI